MGSTLIPVITVDGPSGSGKGTVCRVLAEKYGWHLLDSGALYRAVAVATDWHNVNLDDEERIAQLASDMDLQFKTTTNGVAPLLEGKDIAKAMRAGSCSKAASILSAYPKVRAALLDKQHNFRQLPGLVADGRDMGTVVFPDATLKIFLTADLKVRAERRHQQLKCQGDTREFQAIYDDLKRRDDSDKNRNISPLKPAEDAHICDTTGRGVDEVVDEIVELFLQTSKKKC